jgi:Ser/Thr protein kinase RdoA (MazF antagonist)
MKRTDCYGDLVDPDSLSSDPKNNFTFKFEEGLMECENHLPQVLLDQCRRYYDAHVNLLDSVDGPCIIHRDFRPGNIIVNNGKLEGIIDWASARSSFAEDDFCPWELGEWNTNLSNKQSFLKGYASIRAVPDYEAIMPFLRLNRAIATIGFTVNDLHRV